ncbi:MBOAT family protein [Mucilaginibacter sp. AW1-3]
MPGLLLHIVCFALINLLLILLGYSIVKRGMIWLSWLLLVLSVTTADLIFINEIPVWRMLAIIATTFTAMKLIAVAEAYKGKRLGLSFKQWAIFASSWAGMRAEPFESLGGPALPNALPMVKFGISRIVIGLVLIAAAHGVVALHLPSITNYILVSGLLLVGLSLILHFGLLSISAGMWRRHGANTYLLFRQPATALSLTEFWSKRWNIAFSEMTSVAIFRPLKNRVGAPVALMLSFAFSGLLHELALSLPVNAGYGLPMLYFIIQGLVVLSEKWLVVNNILFLKNKVIARIWVFFWLVVPMPLLFHEQFIKHVVWVLGGVK